MKSQPKRQAVRICFALATKILSNWISYVSNYSYFCVSTTVAAMRYITCLWSFHFSCSDTGTGKGRVDDLGVQTPGPVFKTPSLVTSFTGQGMSSGPFPCPPCYRRATLVKLGGASAIPQG